MNVRHWIAQAIVALSTLAGCGGGSDTADTAIGTEAAAMPSDPAAQTMARLYLSREQANRLSLVLQGDVIWVEVVCCGRAADDLAIMTAYGLQAAHNLPNTTPFIVQGADSRQAAAVADRLTEQGMPAVFLVTR